MSSIRLRTEERNTLLDYYRHHPDPAMRLRAHIVLLLAAGHPWSLLSTVLFCSTRTIARWQQRFAEGGVEALFGQARGTPSRWHACWIALVAAWVTGRSPRDFGFLRSRWCCEVVVLLLWREHGLNVSRETIRRWLRREQIVWRRPRPVVGPKDPDKQAILQALRQQLAQSPANEVWLFQDEVDINTNPKIGCMWMRRGQQAEVVTPGNNEKRYLAGSLNWRTGALLVTEGYEDQGRDADLFIQHLEDLRLQLRCYKVIHVICDNARSHDCKKVRAYLEKWGHRIKIHYLPKYAPETNPIERIWWHLHEEITRNHRCQSMEELLDLVFDWLYSRSHYEIEGSVYPKAKAA